MRLLTTWLISAVVIVSLGVEARGVILQAKELRNTKAPTGSLANSGWQWSGAWGQFSGTAISRQYFITAGHVGGNVGDAFLLNGKSYTTIATYNDPQTDLQMWRIDGTFPSWAPLYKSTSEAERGVMIFGRGTARGSEVVVNNELKGWLWGDQDGAQSWGKNKLIGSVSSSNDAGDKVGGARIYWKFDRNGVSHEGQVSSGDSGGGVFLKDGTAWKLAGVNHAAEAEFSLAPGGTVYKGAIFDVGGLYADSTLIPDTVADNAARGFATRISPRVPWIFAVVEGRVAPSATASGGAGVPEPACAMVVLAAVSLGLARPGRRRGSLVSESRCS